MVDQTPQLQRAVQQAGFRRLTVDPTSQRATLRHRDGTAQFVFVKQARSARRSVREAVALQRIAQSTSGSVPVPALVAQLELTDLPISLLTFIAGEDLATVLPDDAHAPPLPPWYHGQRATIALSPQVLQPLIAALGRVVRALHGIRLPGFGLLVGDDPNPHRHDARAFTYQEARHYLQHGVVTGWLRAGETAAIDGWLRRRLLHIDPAAAPCLVHNDLHPGNIRVAADAGGAWQVSGVVDWEMARGWLPERDLATLSWHLGGVHSRLWSAFESGYGGGGTAQRERQMLFEMVNALGAMAYSPPQAPWGRWCAARITTLCDG